LLDGRRFGLFKGGVHGHFRKSSANVFLIPPAKTEEGVRFCCREPNLTNPMAVDNSGWSRADLRPLMELVLPRDTGRGRICSASRAMSGMRAPPPQRNTPPRK